SPATRSSSSLSGCRLKWRLTSHIDDAPRRVALIETEVVGPQLEEFANIAKLRVLVPGRIHALDWVGLPQPDQRTADHSRPLGVAAERATHLWCSRCEVGARDGQRRGNVGGALVQGVPQRVVLECPQLRSLIQGIQVTRKAPSHHVALEED